MPKALVYDRKINNLRLGHLFMQPVLEPIPCFYEMRTLLPRESTEALRRSLEAWSIFFQKPMK